MVNITTDSWESALAATATLAAERKRYGAELVRLGMLAEDSQAAAQLYVPHRSKWARSSGLPVSISACAS